MTSKRNLPPSSPLEECSETLFPGKKMVPCGRGRTRPVRKPTAQSTSHYITQTQKQPTVHELDGAFWRILFQRRIRFNTTLEGFFFFFCAEQKKHFTTSRSQSYIITVKWVLNTRVSNRAFIAASQSSVRSRMTHHPCVQRFPPLNSRKLTFQAHLAAGGVLNRSASVPVSRKSCK